MIPAYHSWHGKTGPWPREPLDAYLAFLYQMKKGKRYAVSEVHAAASCLGMSQKTSAENLSCWCDVGVVRMIGDMHVELNPEHPCVGPVTPPASTIPVHCL